LDYLLRDSHFCGVNYGRYDIDRVIDAARFHRYDYGGGTELAFDIGGLYALEEMLLARYHMNRQVYGHKTRVATDRMIVRAMTLALADEIIPSDVFITPDDMNEEYVVRYTEWDDRRLVQTLLDANDTAAQEVARALTARRLFKRILNVTRTELADRFDPLFAANILGRSEPRIIDESIPEIEAHVAEAAGIDPHWVSLYWDTRVSPIALPGQTLLSDKDITITSKESGPMRFYEVSEVFTHDQQAPSSSLIIYMSTDHVTEPLEDVIPRVRSSLFEGLEGVASKLTEV
jgi:HD superfamily phosphohydrolase